jgi:hypothetical protein
MTRKDPKLQSALVNSSEDFFLSNKCLLGRKVTIMVKRNNIKINFA